MSTLWHTLVIKVPREMVDFTPKGKVSVKKTLTKMGSIAKSRQKPSIKIMPSTDGEVHVIPGKTVSIRELKKEKKQQDMKSKIMDDKNPIGLKASMDGVLEYEKRLRNADTGDEQMRDILKHNLKYFKDLVKKNEAILKKSNANQLRLSEPIKHEIWDKYEQPALEKEDVPVPKKSDSKISKKILDQFEYLKKEDIDFILKHGIDEEIASEIDSVQSMIAYYIDAAQFKEQVFDPIEETMQVGKKDSDGLKKWKNFMRDTIMKGLHKIQKPTQAEIIKRIYADLKPEDVKFIIENEIHDDDDISKINNIRLRLLQTKKKDLQEVKDNWLKPQMYDNQILKKWKNMVRGLM